MCYIQIWKLLILEFGLIHFSDADIDGECLISLTDSNVGVLGLSLGHRLKLLGYIDDLKTEKGKLEDTVQVVTATISVVTNVEETADTINDNQVIEPQINVTKFSEQLFIRILCVTVFLFQLISESRFQRDFNP